MNYPYPSVQSAVEDQKARNRETSRNLDRVQLAMNLRKKRHSEILTYVEKFLNKPYKKVWGRFLYSVLWKIAEKIENAT